ncbi:L,D-transpeptidase family protein [Stappia sp.]|uniref:L,D-transpeptidase family protein n=1 Tax=Stappia sp. TaxID=1870903 RepID=UPI003A9A316B
MPFARATARHSSRVLPVSSALSGVSRTVLAAVAGVALISCPALANTVVSGSAPAAASAVDSVVPAPDALPEAEASARETPAEARLLERMLREGEGLSQADAELSFVTPARRKAILSVYQARDFAPLWSAQASPSLAARGLLVRLRHADRDGLRPADYALPKDLASTAGTLDEATAARFDVLLSLALVAYADHAQAGRVEPESLSKLTTAKPTHPDIAAALESIASANDPVVALDGFNPPQDGFQALRRKLAELTRPGAADERPPVVPDGKVLKLGVSDERVVVLRQRLGLAEAPDAEAAEPVAAVSTDGETAPQDEDVVQALDASMTDPAFYDERVKQAVADFQKDNGLHPDGVVGPRTLLALNAVSDDGMAVSDVIANMERWRWMPRDLGTFHVFVNIPEFKARLIRDGQPVYETRVVVGKPQNQTPVFSDEMDHVIVNPYWNVPYSIASQELLPAARANSSYLASRNYEVVSGGRVVDASAIDWSGVNLRSVRIRQRPGGGNALGKIKFMFPNRHSVYLHDTPSKSLFSRSSRAFSHGCVRVQDPFDFADALLQLDPRWDAKKLKAMIGGQEKRVDLSSRIPVHLAYFTAFVDENGLLQRRPDIYGHNATLTKALGIDGWQDWQRFAVVVRQAPPAPVQARKETGESRKAEALSIKQQRAKLMQLRMRGGNDMYR